MIQYCEIISPLGKMLAAARDDKLVGLWFYGQKYFPATSGGSKKETQAGIFASLQNQLTEYFARKRQVFDLPLAPEGSPFRMQTWLLLQKIPFGETVTYGELATSLAAPEGKPPAAQAVGSAVGHNPLSILIPCHRVLAKDGKLTGYAGGLDKKAALLQLEGIHSFRS